MQTEGNDRLDTEGGFLATEAAKDDNVAYASQREHNGALEKEKGDERKDEEKSDKKEKLTVR